MLVMRIVCTSKNGTRKTGKTMEKEIGNLPPCAILRVCGFCFPHIICVLVPVSVNRRRQRSEAVFILSCHYSYGPPGSLLLRLDFLGDDVGIV
jgi:hypothetical protein